jgi:twitching motility two-component system response regulator PilH
MPASILLVDDEFELVDALSRVLRGAGYVVRSARDGESAIAEVKQHAPDLILSDVIMPGLNGYQMCRRLKQDPATREVPVLLMSAKTEPADHFWAQQVGAIALLSKPMDNRELIQRVAQALGQGREGSVP